MVASKTDMQRIKKEKQTWFQTVRSYSQGSTDRENDHLNYFSIVHLIEL